MENIKSKEIKLYGMPWYFFAIFAVIVILGTVLGELPGGMIGALPLMIVLGVVLNKLGSTTPIVKSFLGGGAIVCIFGAAALNNFGIIPEDASKTIYDFMKSGGFLNFYIAALITGSIFGMNRKLLVKAAIRYLPAIIGGVAFAMLLTGLVGMITGYGAQKAILYICIPIMGGGMGAGAIPLSQIFGESLGVDPGQMLSIMVPAVALGNAMAVVVGGLLNSLGKKRKSLSGDGALMRNGSYDNEGNSEEFEKKRDTISLPNLGVGVLVSTSFYVAGAIINRFIPSLHTYACMILLVAIVKVVKVMPEKIEICCYQWYQFIMKNLTTALLVGIGIAYTNLNQVADAMSIQYILLVTATIVGATLGAGFVGKLVGFYPIESSITAGLCMANMGGTGDVAVLSASDRMELMPFSQISSRIGGAFMLILSSIILQII